MIIVWQGLGAWAIGLPLIAIVLTNVIVGESLGPTYGESHAWPKVVALITAGFACWFWGRYLHTRPGRVLIEKATGREITDRPRHAFFFVPLEYWGVGWIVLGVVYAYLT